MYSINHVVIVLLMITAYTKLCQNYSQTYEHFSTWHAVDSLDHLGEHFCRF